MLKKSLLTIFFIAAIIGLIYIYVNSKTLGSRSNSPIEQKFTIENGEGVNQISSRLEKQGLISDNLFFDLYIWKNKREEKIVSGAYTLRPNMTIPEIIDIITKGEAEPQDVKITIIEGWTAKQIGEYLAKNNISTQKDFENEVKEVTKYQEEYAFLESLDPQADTLEGFLFPDTYFIYPNATVKMIVKKMLDNFDKKVTPSMRADALKNDRSLKEIINMASIVEREVSNREDQKLVSGIFWDRIKIDHPLQADATLSYILGTNKIKYSTSDSRVDSPYNTYTNKGLPPGPISNPGIDAITAAIYPTPSDYFYFLTDAQTNEVIYSRTFEEHVRNKEKHGL